MKYRIFKDNICRSHPKYIAQEQLSGLTHYVDDATLRFHHARVLNEGIACDGLIYWIIESVALDMHNTSRGVRYVCFNIFGQVISRVDLDDSFKTSKQALKAMREFLASYNAKAVTKAAYKSLSKLDQQSVKELKQLLAA